jgi:hypothetical protein
MQLKKYIKINNYLKDKTRNKKEYINKYLNRNEVKKNGVDGPPQYALDLIYI